MDLEVRGNWVAVVVSGIVSLPHRALNGFAPESMTRIGQDDGVGRCPVGSDPHFQDRISIIDPRKVCLGRVWARAEAALKVGALI